MASSVKSIGDRAFNNCLELKRVYFEGNAPAYESDYDLSLYAFMITAYYRNGTTGWGATFGGMQTVCWTPTYQEWTGITGLLDQFPQASAETDDADHDGMNNLAEMQAGTDPVDPKSKLAFESSPRINDLADEDKTAIGLDQHALFFHTVPGMKYEIKSVAAFGGVWQTETNVTATTTQKRVLVKRPTDQAFYRVVLVP